MSPIDIGVSLSSANSSAAQSGDATFGDFIVGGGKNTAPGWIWPVVILAALFIAWKFIKRK